MNENDWVNGNFYQDPIRQISRSSTTLFERKIDNQKRKIRAMIDKFKRPSTPFRFPAKHRNGAGSNEDEEGGVEGRNEEINPFLSARKRLWSSEMKISAFPNEKWEFCEKTKFCRKRVFCCRLFPRFAIFFETHMKSTTLLKSDFNNFQFLCCYVIFIFCARRMKTLLCIQARFIACWRVRGRGLTDDGWYGVVWCVASWRVQARCRRMVRGSRLAGRQVAKQHA